MNVDDVMCKICDRCKFTYMCPDEDSLYANCATCPVEADIKVLVAAAAVKARADTADQIMNASKEA